MTDIVLVTGGTGFIAKHCIAELLRAGRRVRTTARDVDRGRQALAGALVAAGVDAGAVDIVPADLTQDEGWDAAVTGCRYVLHVASPFPITQPANRDEVVKPARDGTLRVLAAAARGGVERVVMTSSTVAVMYTPRHVPGRLYSESDWSDETRQDITPYIASKTLAERAAWDFVASTPDAPKLVVINPGFVMGPALDADISTSLEVLRIMGSGAYPAAPRIEFPVVDVRDVAALHVAALDAPRAAGERFIAANGSISPYGIGREMAAIFPDLARKVPRFEMPDLMVRTIALFDPRLRTVLPELGTVRRCTNAKAQDVFGFQFRSPEEASRAGAESLRRLRLI
ncbi:MAG: SDR family oxidoreductase [Hyphomicrobiaceae bacterium]